MKDCDDATFVPWETDLTYQFMRKLLAPKMNFNNFL